MNEGQLQKFIENVSNKGDLEIEARFSLKPGKGISKKMFDTFLDKISDSGNFKEVISFETDRYYGAHRVTENQNGEKEAIKKDTIDNFLYVDKEIHVKVNAAREIKLKYEEPKREPDIIREKKRNSFTAKSGMIRIDFTRTKQNGIPKYELEVEFLSKDLLKLKPIVDKIASGLNNSIDEVSDDKVVNFFNYALSGIHQKSIEINYKYLSKARDLGIKDFTDKGILNPKVQYKLTLKADGVQCFMLIYNSWLYLIRPWFKNNEEKVIKKSNITSKLNGTVIVGELLEEKDFKEGFKPVTKYTFIPYDVVSYKQKSVSSENYNFRLSILEDIPVNDLQVPGNEISIMYKNFYDIGVTSNTFYSSFESVIRDEENSVFKTDGFIVTPIFSDYVAEGQYRKQNERVLDKFPDVGKIKPFEKMSIDFYVEDNELYVVTYRGKLERFRNLFTDRDRYIFTNNNVSRDLDLGLDKKIVEFAPRMFDNEIVYYPERIREDKNIPNKADVAKDIWRKAHEPINKETLLGQDIEFMKSYHNEIKRNLLKNVHEGDYILDIGSGRGGDLGKWIFLDAKQILAIEPDEDNIKEFKDRLSRTNLKNTKLKLIKSGGEETKKIYREARDFFDFRNLKEDTKFNVIMMLSLSFFWKDREMLNGLANTINSIRELWESNGGKSDNFQFIYFTIEGNETKKLLEKNGGSITLNDVEMKMKGEKIKINIKDSIVTNQTEYLVYLQDLWNLLGFKTESERANQRRLLSEKEKIYSSLFVYGVAKESFYDKEKGRERIKVDITKGYRLEKGGIIAYNDDKYEEMYNGLRRLGTIDLGHSLINSLAKLLDINYRNNQDYVFRSLYYKNNVFFKNIDENSNIIEIAEKLKLTIVVIEGEKQIFYGNGDTFIFLCLCEDNTYEPVVYAEDGMYHYQFTKDSKLLKDFPLTSCYCEAETQSFKGFRRYGYETTPENILKGLGVLEEICSS